MRGVILAGGRGTRLRPVTLEIPKELIPVHGRPVISWIAEHFAEAGVEDIAVVISPEKHEDFRWWQRRWGRRLPLHLFVEPEPLGTLGPLLMLRDFLAGTEPFFVANGDVLTDVDLHEMQELHATHGDPATIALVEHDEPQHYGVAVVDGTRIAAFIEKPSSPPTNLINAGRYLLSPAVLSGFPEEQTFRMIERELFPLLSEKGKLHGYAYSGQWHDCGTIERWEEAIAQWGS
jgi:NDP-sugar pyrophosphorylase family protein